MMNYRTTVTPSTRASRTYSGRSGSSYREDRRPQRTRYDTVTRSLVGCLCRILRVPILMLLVTIEPLAAFLCAVAALLGILATVFFKLAATPHFPTATMLVMSLSFGLILFLYESVIRVLSR